MKKLSGLVVALLVMLVSLMSSAQAQAGEDRYVRVFNDTGYVVEYIYLSHSSRSGWGTDRLGSQVLLSGYNIRVYPADGTQRCIYDLRAELADGRSAERREVDICGGRNWTLH